MADRFVQSYLTISDPSERTRALNGFVDAISHSDRQALCSIIDKKNDIVSRLPTELVLEIFGYLDLLDAWRLQKVNRRWCRILSSEDILRPSLARWESHDPEDSARRSDADTMPERIQHLHALRHGKPFTQTILDYTGIEFEGAHPQFRHFRFEFKRDKIAYITSRQGDESAVIVRDLVTGAASMLRGIAKERILMLTLTTSVVAFVNYEGTLYVTQIADHLMLGETIKVRLPSSSVRAMRGQGDRIAIAMGTGGIEHTHVTSILTYDLKSRTLRSFPVETKQRELEQRAKETGSGSRRTKNNTCGLLVDNSKRCVDLFMFYAEVRLSREGTLNEPKRLVLTHLRVSFTGEMRESGIWVEPANIADPEREVSFAMLPPHPTGRKNEFRIQVSDAHWTRSPPAHFKFDIMFNSQSASLMPSESSTRFVHLDALRKHIVSDRRNTSLYVQWKGLMITADDDVEKRAWIDCGTMMNDTFLVVVEGLNTTTGDRSRIRVFCFDGKIAAKVGKDYGLWGDARDGPAAKKPRTETD